MDVPLDARAGQRGHPRDDRREPARRLLHPAHRLPRLRPARASTRSPRPVDVAIMVWDWGKYLGQEALEQGVDVCVSSWTRMAPNTLPAMAKSARQLHELAAHQDGGDQGRLRRGHRARRRRATSPRAAARTSSWSSKGAPDHAARSSPRCCRASRATASSPSRAASGSRSRRRRSRARCSTSPTSSSSPAPRPRSRRSARWTRRRSARARAGPSPRRCRRPSST